MVIDECKNDWVACDMNKSIASKFKRPLRKFAYVVGLKKHETADSYKKIIPAEIQGGQFFELIKDIVKRPEIKTILEIGSSSGEGSTRAILESLALLPSDYKQVHCLEISAERHLKLEEYLKSDNRFKAHRLSSITPEDFPDFEAVSNFYINIESKLNKYEIDTVRSWYEKDISYIYANPELTPMDSNGVKIGGISWIKKKYGISEFDFVLIDGGEFTGFEEFMEIRSSIYIALDDTQTFKSWKVRESLLSNSEYRLIAENLNERNGWSIFVKKDLMTSSSFIING